MPSRAKSTVRDLLKALYFLRVSAANSGFAEIAAILAEAHTRCIEATYDSDGNTKDDLLPVANCLLAWLGGDVDRATCHQSLTDLAVGNSIVTDNEFHVRLSTILDRADRQAIGPEDAIADLYVLVTGEAPKA